MDEKSSTMEVLLERSHSHFVAQLWLPPLLELHSKEVKRAATNSMLFFAGRNPSVRSHKTTKSFGGWLCENLLGLQILWKSQISSLRTCLNHQQVSKKPQWLEFESKCGVGRSGCKFLHLMRWKTILQCACSAILLKIWTQKMVKCVVIVFFHDFHRFFEVVAVLLVICYTKLMLIFEKSW